MVIYESAYEYLTTATDDKQQVARLNQLIVTLTNHLIGFAMKSHIAEYSLDDGQSKIKTVYRSAKELTSQIQVLKDLRDMWENDYNNKKTGRIIRLVDSKNFGNLC